MALKATYSSSDQYYCDKFDTSLVSSLSLFLFQRHYFLFAKDANGRVAAVHQQGFSDLSELQTRLKEDKILRFDIPRKVFTYGESFSLVPGMVFDSSLLSVYLFFAEKPKEDEKTFQTNLESNALHLVGSISQEIAGVLQTQSSDTSFHHGASCFLSYALKEKFNLIDQEILLLLHQGFFYLAAFSKQELLLFNRFEAENREGLLRYTMGILQQLGFSRNHCRISMYGNTVGFDIDKVWAAQYFKNFRISTPHPNVQYLEGPDGFQNPNIFESYWELP